jgi:hypothetical protein
MKTIVIIFLMVIGLFFQQSINESELIGSWTALKASGENKPCDKNSQTVKDFRLNFLQNNNYEMQMNYGSIQKTKGKYIFDTKSKIIKLKSDNKKSNQTLNIPIISLTKDKLIIKYNLCAEYDTTSYATGQLELKKQ